MVITIVITIWHLWSIVVVSWSARALLRCGLAWDTAAHGTDWRAIAWRCQWEVLGVLAMSVASIWLLRTASVAAAVPGWCGPVVLALLGLRALLDLPPLIVLWRARLIPTGKAVLRWHGLLLRLRYRHLARSWLIATRPYLLLRRVVGRRQYAARRAAPTPKLSRAPRD